MLEAVNVIHEERIVHSDLKPANFVLIRNTLKLIDFGIAKAIANDTTNIQRDSQVTCNLPLCPRISSQSPLDRYPQLHESRNHERRSRRRPS
jgi:serine/threonine protein kinase